MRGLLAASLLSTALLLAQGQVARAQTEPLAPPEVEVIEEEEPALLGWMVAGGTLVAGLVFIDFVTGHALSGRILGRGPAMVGRGVCKVLWARLATASKVAAPLP